MKQVTIAFFVALAVSAGIGLLIVPSMDQAERARLMVADNGVMYSLLADVCPGKMKE